MGQSKTCGALKVPLLGKVIVAKDPVHVKGGQKRSNCYNTPAYIRDSFHNHSPLTGCGKSTAALKARGKNRLLDDDPIVPWSLQP